MELFEGLIKFIDQTNTASNASLWTTNTTSRQELANLCNNTKLNGSMFVDNHYCNVNFNDILNSFVLIASLLIVNNWHDILYNILTRICNRVTNVPRLGEILYEALNCAISKD
jgi:hypothetical protein